MGTGRPGALVGMLCVAQGGPSGARCQPKLITALSMAGGAPAPSHQDGLPCPKSLGGRGESPWSGLHRTRSPHLNLRPIIRGDELRPGVLPGDPNPSGGAGQCVGPRESFLPEPHVAGLAAPLRLPHSASRCLQVAQGSRQEAGGAGLTGEESADVLGSSAPQAGTGSSPPELSPRVGATGSSHCACG